MWVITNIFSCQHFVGHARKTHHDLIMTLKNIIGSTLEYPNPYDTQVEDNYIVQIIENGTSQQYLLMRDE